MSKKPFPVANVVYETPGGFSVWYPAIKRLQVQHPKQGETIITVSQPGSNDVLFVLNDIQRKALIDLLTDQTTTNQGA